MSENSGDGRIVVVPHRPGPLVRPAAGDSGRRERDDLDLLIDELLPDTSEGPGVVDAALVAGGAAVLGWAAVGSPPPVAVVAGVAALGLGCILPARAAWRRLADRRRARRQRALLGRGTPLRTSSPAVARLVARYEQLDAMPVVPEAARAAAHGALLEVASLLGGRAPASERERAYVEARATALEELVSALADLEAASITASPGEEEQPAIDPDLVVAAREELEGGLSSLARLDDVTAEVRARARGR